MDQKLQFYFIRGSNYLKKFRSKSSIQQMRPDRPLLLNIKKIKSYKVNHEERVKKR